MKANWERDDRSQMAVRRLSFAPDDVALIHAGLARQRTPSVAEVREPAPN
jgi:hypothetical protein